MPSLEESITGFVPGDAISFRRTVDRDGAGNPDESLPPGATITKAWLTVKASPSDADPGLVQKEVTPTNNPGTGQIENDGGGDVDPVIRFDLEAADTVAIGAPASWDDAPYYDMQILTDAGLPHTFESGRIKGSVEQVTKATS